MPAPRRRIFVKLETADTAPPLRRWLARQFRAAAAALDVPACEITLAVVGDARMSEAHERHLGIAGPTDVMTFDLRQSPVDPLEADLLICLDEARRQAAARGHDPRVEVLLYAVHGLLHLIGHDDHRPADARRMHAVEDRIMGELGFGPVYASAVARKPPAVDAAAVRRPSNRRRRARPTRG